MGGTEWLVWFRDLLTCTSRVDFACLLFDGHKAFTLYDQQVDGVFHTIWTPKLEVVIIQLPPTLQRRNRRAPN